MMKHSPQSEQEDITGSDQLVEQHTVSSDSADNPKHTERNNRTAPVYVYLIVLFVAAFAMLLLAYLIQRRNDAAAVYIPLRIFLDSPTVSGRAPDFLVPVH